MTRSGNRRRLLAGAATLSLAGFASLGTTACNPNPATTTFAYTGAPQTYVVPGDVCAVSVVAMGAQGGAGTVSTWTVLVGGGHTTIALPDDGGLGAGAASTIAVTPGESLQVNVGGTGDGVGLVEDDGGAFTTPDAGEGGWNGGADGGTDVNQGAIAGGGGGASDVRQGGTGMADRVVVAGGGGGTGAGSGISHPSPVGGVGGNPGTSGQSGSHLGVDVYGNGSGGGFADPISYGTGAGGGGGATAAAGGTGGSGGVDGTSVGTIGNPGALGIGGAGADSVLTGGSDLGGFTGGGGGGGLYGGGGGGSAAYTPAPYDPSNPLPMRRDRVVGAGGGGGSSLGATVVAGLHQGAGLVTITPVDGPCGGSPAAGAASTTVAAAKSSD
jgi:hypothetical protein